MTKAGDVGPDREPEARASDEGEESSGKYIHMQSDTIVNKTTWQLHQNLHRATAELYEKFINGGLRDDLATGLQLWTIEFSATLFMKLMTTLTCASSCIYTSTCKLCTSTHDTWICKTGGSELTLLQVSCDRLKMIHS